MSLAKYDETSQESILDFASRLTGKRLRDFLTPEQQLAIISDKKNKGKLGTLVENYYFCIYPGSSPYPDFPKANLELKTAAVIPSTGRKRKGALTVNPSAYQAKERLKLTTINYMNLVHETWEENELFKKCAHILLLLSLYDAQLDEIDRKFIAEPIMWTLSEKDVDFIMRDWNTIVSKIRNGEAHNLSGSDTLYLEACTSGTGKNLPQPYSATDAKERSFAFKASFVDVSFLRGRKFVEELVSILDEDDAPEDFEKIALRKLNQYGGMRTQDIAESLSYELSSAKHWLALLSYRILGVKSNKVEEFVKAGIEIKTVNLDHNGKPGEDISFPAFSYMDIIGEEWEDSTFMQKVDSKTLFVVYQTDRSGVTTFRKACFWNMPQADIEEARRVWEETKERVADGRADKLPRKDFSDVAHVRNHARTSRPEHDIPSPKNGMLRQKGFWLNAKYVQKQLEPLLG